MRQIFDIEMDDGQRYQVTTDSRDVRRWESAYDLSWLSTPWSYTQAAQVAFLAGTRLGVFDGRYPSYDDFDAHAIEVKAHMPDEPLTGNPTPSVVGADSFADSPTD